MVNQGDFQQPRDVGELRTLIAEAEQRAIEERLDAESKAQARRAVLDTRLREIEARLLAGENQQPLNARRQVGDGHPHMRSIEGFDDDVSLGDGYQVNWRRGLSATRDSWPTKRRFDVDAVGVGMCFDYIVLKNWAGTEGQEFTKFDQVTTFKVYSTIGGAATAASAQDATTNPTILICPGAYVEDVDFTGPATSKITLWGIARRAVSLIGSSSGGIALGHSAGGTTVFDVHGMTIQAHASSGARGISDDANSSAWYLEACEVGSGTNSGGIAINPGIPAAVAGFRLVGCDIVGSGIGFADGSGGDQSDLWGSVFLEGCLISSNVGALFVNDSNFHMEGGEVLSGCDVLLKNNSSQLGILVSLNGVRVASTTAAVQCTGLASFRSLSAVDCSFNSITKAFDFGSGANVGQFNRIIANTFITGTGSDIGVDDTSGALSASIILGNTFQGYDADNEIVGVDLSDNIVVHNTTDSGATLPDTHVGGGLGIGPDDAQYLVLALDGDLSAERRFVPGTAITAVDGGADGDYTINHEQVAAGDLHTEYILHDGTRAFTGAPDAGGNVINNVANPVLGGDAVNLNTLLDSMTIAFHYHFLASNVMSSVFSAGEAFEDELITGTPQELTTIFQVSTAADTPTPATVGAGTLISVHFDAAVLATAGKLDAFVYVQVGYVDPDGSSNFVQIGSDSDPTTVALTTDKEEVELHVHVAAETTIPAGKRLKVKWWATTGGAGNDPTIHIYYGALPDHITIPISASILGNYLPLAGGTMTGAIAMDGNAITGAAQGIGDNALVTVDGPGAGAPNSGEYGKWTAAGLEGRTATEVLADLSAQAGATFDFNGQSIIAPIVYGSDAANEDLLLQATSHATRATSQVQLFVDTNATMTLNATAQIFGSAINEVQFLNVTAVDFTNAAGFEIVRFSDASAAGGPAVTFATGELQVNEDIDISGHIAIGAAASVDATAGAVLVLAETSTAEGAVEVNQMDIAHTYTPGAISSAMFRGIRMDVTAGGDEDIDGAFLAGAYALQFVTQHDSEGDINQMFGATGQCIMGNNPLDAASTNTPQFDNLFAQGVGLQGLFIYSANDGYAGAAFDIFPGAVPLGVKAIDAQLQLRSFHDAGRAITMNAEASGIAVTMNTDNQAVGPKTNRITITNLAGVRISHVDTASSATIIRATMLNIGAWSSQPTITSHYGIVQEGILDHNWLGGFTYIGGPSLRTISTINNAVLTSDQNEASGNIPPLLLIQSDVSEEMIEFISTIGVGNAIEAKGGKSLTETHFIKVTLPGPLTRYIEVGTIA